MLDKSLNPEKILCVSCVKENDGLNDFCEFCYAPLSFIANSDPVKLIHAESFLFGKALEKKPKPVVVIGLWVIFLPALLGSLLMAGKMLTEIGGGLAPFIFFWGAVGIGYLSFVFIYRVTRNYFAVE